jgi:hypothetical protein
MYLTDVESGILEYWHRNVINDLLYKCKICAVNSSGDEGEPAYCEVR